MVQQQILEGTGTELQEHLRQHPEERFRLIPLSTPTAPTDQSTATGLRRGMFPQLKDLTEEDFKSVEWRGEDDDL